ncbi:hypothetical protein OsJ_00444 [Oryza sativa Japonica Group]|uniref:Uncharacterized protein n=1 Tax=Oryza sativa subsp. japonica TaxID=39947 RepID=B9ESY6_ORYSJ|nr:hypothetical protein OsJ_00444 [Oryza sativa Japonica Group]
MAEEENPWKPLFWWRVDAINQRVRVVREDLAAVEQQLASRVDKLSVASCAGDKLLMEASRALGLAVCYMEAARLLARHRGGLIAQGRIPSRHGRVHDDDLAVRRALFYLRLAKARAEEACDALDRCRGHLGAVKMLLRRREAPAGVADHVDGICRRLIPFIVRRPPAMNIPVPEANEVNEPLRSWGLPWFLNHLTRWGQKRGDPILSRETQGATSSLGPLYTVHGTPLNHNGQALASGRDLERDGRRLNPFVQCP